MAVLAWFKLQSQPMRPARPDREKPKKEALPKLRILTADDDEVVLKVLQGLLDTAEWEICGEAVDGVDAVEKTRALKPDIVIMDLPMPGDIMLTPSFI